MQINFQKGSLTKRETESIKPGIAPGNRKGIYGVYKKDWSIPLTHILKGYFRIEWVVNRALRVRRVGQKGGNIHPTECYSIGIHIVRDSSFIDEWFGFRSVEPREKCAQRNSKRQFKCLLWMTWLTSNNNIIIPWGHRTAKVTQPEGLSLCNTWWFSFPSLEANAFL